jgi:hypothetical protein
VDSKYDLNNDRAPVLAIVAENDAGFGTPLAFGKKKLKIYFKLQDKVYLQYILFILFKVYLIKKIIGQLVLH